MAKTLEDKINDLLFVNDPAVSKKYESWIKQTIADTESELALLLEEESVPEKYQFIVSKVVVKRFNRRRDEGLKAKSQAEARVEYETDDFAEFRGIIGKYVDEKNDTTKPKPGRFRFV